MNDRLLTPHSRPSEPKPRDRITAIASAMQRRPIVIVLGVPGSGASLCAHILSALGVDMVDVETGSSAGPWERAELVALHDRILALFNRTHLGPFHDFALPVAWWADPRVAGIKREIVACLDARMGAGYFGFKDPRAVRLLPVWQQVANELKLAPRLVLCLRNPAQIAALSSTRDGFDPAIGEYRWLANTVDFFRHANSFDICTVEYENWFEDPSANITILKEFLGLEWQQGENDLSLLISGIIDAAGQAEQAGRREPSQPLVRSLYKLARRASGDREARQQITDIAVQFVGFQQLQRPFQLAFEEVAQTAAKFPAIEQELDTLRTTAVERDALVETQRAKIEDLAREHDARTTIEGEASGLRATLAEREAALAMLSRQVDDLTTSLQSAQAERTAQQEAVQRAEQAAQQQTASTEVMQGEVAAPWEALAHPEHAAQERGAVADAVQGEIAVLREALERTEQEAQQRDAAAVAVAAELIAAEASQAEAAILREALVRSELLSSDCATARAANQSEVSALRDRLALGERERDERAVAGKALQRELTSLRQALKQAEREVQQSADGTQAMRSEVAKLRNALAQAEITKQEWAAAAAVLQAEIDSLRDTVGAARQVGKVAIAALQISGEALPQPNPQQRRWCHVPARIFGAVKEYRGGQPDLVPQSDRGEVASDHIFDTRRIGRQRRRERVITLADHARDAREWKRAAGLYKAALDRDPHNSPIWVQYGHALKESGELRDPDKLAQAERAYRRSLSLEPRTSDTYLQLGHVLKLQRKIKEAQAAYLRAFALDPSAPFPPEELSGLGWSKKQLSELLSLLRPNDAEALCSEPRNGSSAALRQSGSISTERLRRFAADLPVDVSVEHHVAQKEHSATSENA